MILAVTAWERSFLEDTVTSEFNVRLDRAETPRDVLTAFNTVAEVWLSHKRRPPELLAWAGGEWKIVLRDQGAREIAALNSPNSANVTRLTRRLLGQDVTTSWHWTRVPVNVAKKRLDAFIALRGKLVHRTKLFHDLRAAVKRRDLADAISLLKRLMERTEEALGRQPKALTSNA